MKDAARILLALAVTGLTACGGSQGDLQEWMAQQQKTIKPRIETITAPKKFIPQPYTAIDLTEPFNARKMEVATQAARQSNALLAAESQRRKEPLEAYPLDNLQMVGTMVRGGQPVALINVDKMLHYVRVGEYMGQNFGRITKITDHDVTLREIVQDAAGEWIERTSTLQLQEKVQ